MKNLIIGRGEIGLALNITTGWDIVSHQDIDDPNVDFSSYENIIITTLDKSIYCNKINLKNSFEAKVLSKFQGQKITFFSSRMVYLPNYDLKESSPKQVLTSISDKGLYGYNKLRLEDYIRSETDNFLLLRLPNFISKYPAKDRFWGELMLSFKNSNVKINMAESQKKDFILPNYLKKILIQLLQNNVIGVFNVAYEKKYSIGQIIEVIREKYPQSRIKYSDESQDAYTLDISKLKEHIDISDDDFLIDLKNYIKD